MIDGLVRCMVCLAVGAKRVAAVAAAFFSTAVESLRSEEKGDMSKRIHILYGNMTVV